MEKSSTLITNVFNNGKEYLQLKSKSLQLEVYNKVSGLFALMVSGAIVASLSVLALLFVNIGIGFALSIAFRSHVWGFLSLGGIYVVLLGIFIAVRKPIDTKLKNAVVLKLSENKYTEYEQVTRERIHLKAELERSENLVKGNAKQLQENLEIMAEDLRKLKEEVQRFRSLFSFGEQKPEEPQGGKAAGSSPVQELKKMALTKVAELIINRLVVKDVNSIKQLIWPTLAKVLVSAGLSNEKNTDEQKGESTGFLKSLISKLSKFL
jgi:hypothetical protein